MARELNEKQILARRESVKRFANTHERINVQLPAGTLERIRALGYTGNGFAKTVILAELEKMESLAKISVTIK